MSGLSEQEVDVIVEAAHPSRPDRLQLTRRHVEAIVAAREAAARAEVLAEVEALVLRCVKRVRHDHAYPMEVGPHHCDGCDLEADLRAILARHACSGPGCPAAVNALGPLGDHIEAVKAYRKHRNQHGIDLSCGECYTLLAAVFTTHDVVVAALGGDS